MTRSTAYDREVWRCRALDRYIYMGVLGVGGSCVVYRARDRSSGAEVAIKLPRTLDATQRWTTRARLLREAEALRAVRHPHVVGLRDVGVADGLVYLVIDRLAATPLGERRLTRRSALAIGRQIGGALAAVHAAGLVHRDVAPGNVLVAASTRAWLIDFGLTRAIDPARAGVDDFTALPLTAAGPGAGTPGFVAPEQRDGAEIDGRVDQYGLCATLWRGLTGEPAAAASDRPGARDPLLGVLRRGLAERPGRRHRDMQALVSALAGCRSV